MTGWRRRSTENCARNCNLTIPPKGICPNQNPSWRMRHRKFSGVLRYKRITEDQTKWRLKRKDKKGNLLNSGLCRSGGPQSKKSKKTTKETCSWTFKAIEHEGDSDTNCNRCPRNDLQRLGKRAERVENRRTSRDHPNYSIVKIGKNILKRLEDLRRRAILIWLFCFTAYQPFLGYLTPN